MRDVDQTAGPERAALHQVEKIGARGEIGGAWLGSRNCLRNRGWPHIIEALHAAALRSRAERVFCASSTASVMP
jgi:hypothetical protein